MALRRIVLVNQSTGYLFLDVVLKFAEYYDEVILICGKSGKLNRKLPSNVKVINIYDYNRSSISSRLISWVFGFIQVYFIIAFRYNRDKVVLSSNPPLLTILPYIIRNDSYLISYDLYPEALETSGFTKSTNYIFRGWSNLNKKAFRRVNKIFTLSNTMAELLSLSCSRDKIIVVPPWPEDDFTNSDYSLFREHYSLNDKFVLFYSGNLGKEYEIEHLLEIALKLRSNPEIVVFIAGEGYKKEKIHNLISSKGLTNVVEDTYLPNELYRNALKTVDLGIVCEAKVAANICIPSKAYNIIGAGLPILSFGLHDSDLGKMILENQIGYVSNGSDIDEAAKFINTLYLNKDIISKIRQNTIKLSKSFSRENIKAIISPIAIQ